MAKACLNRFEWQKAVLQQRSLTASTRLVASALATQFANDETGQLNPAMQTLCEFLGVSMASVKRAVRVLVMTGWLRRTEGRGRGNVTTYTLAAPAKIVPFKSTRKPRTARQEPPKAAQKAPQERGSQAIRTPSQKGSPVSLYPKQKGSNFPLKGVTSEPSYIEQSKEQKDAILRAFRDTRFEGNPFAGLKAVEVKAYRTALSDWGRWLTDHGLPELHNFALRTTSEKGNAYWYLPWTNPPDSEAKKRQALRFFRALLDMEASRLAAQ